MIDLAPEHQSILRSILLKYIPEHEVRVFGSRKQSGAKQTADLDLLIMSGSPLPVRTMALLCDALRESDLPMRVDVIDRAATDTNFLQRIEQQSVIFETTDL